MWSRPSQRGLALLFLLIAVAVLAVAMTAAQLLWSTEAREQRETQLLVVGDAYRRAIESYYFAIPGHPAYPQRVADLLADPRFPQVVRHLRQAYRDPLTGETLDRIHDPVSGGIMGVYSKAPGVPLKIANFPRQDAAFDGATSYAQWRFEFAPLDGHRR